MEKKIEELLNRLAQVEELLGQPDLHSDQKRFRELAQEHAHLSDLKHVHEKVQIKEKQLIDNSELLSLIENDPLFLEVLQADSVKLQAQLEELRAKRENLIVPPDPNDSRNTILELRAGTGGEEAALFVADCVRMYRMYADRMGWKCEELSSTPSDMGGYKEYVMAVSGLNVYRFLRYEGGTHRVQRVPDTEAQGRVHTSAITIAVMLEPEEDSDVVIVDKDLRVDTYRSSGAGGQHINTTDSAVRLTHLPTGIVVYCQDERSQHKNKDKALRLLRAKIAEVELQKKNEARASDRAKQVGSGDRSERIRTYNYSQNRITDHRINKTGYNLDRVMEGDLEDFVMALVAYYYQLKFQ